MKVGYDPERGSSLFPCVRVGVSLKGNGSCILFLSSPIKRALSLRLSVTISMKDKKEKTLTKRLVGGLGRFVCEVRRVSKSRGAISIFTNTAASLSVHTQHALVQQHHRAPQSWKENTEIIRHEEARAGGEILKGGLGIFFVLDLGPAEGMSLTAEASRGNSIATNNKSTR